MSYKLIWEKSGVIFSYSDNVTSEDAINSNEKYYSDSRSDDIKYQIADFSSIDKITFNDDIVELIAHMDYVHFSTTPTHINKVRKIAFVGTEDTMRVIQDLYKLVLFEHNSSLQVNYFNKIEPAKHWVDCID